MARRRAKKGPKLPHIIRQYTSTEPPDGTRLVPGPSGSPPAGRHWIHRLSMLPTLPMAYTPSDLAHGIDNSPDDAVFFCDANMFIAPTDDAIWQALFRRRQARLIPPVYKELKDWLNDDVVSNPQAQLAVKAIVAGDPNPPIQGFQFGPLNATLEQAINYYVNLLGVRKKIMGFIGEQLAGELGREPSRQEVNNRCQQLLGSRGMKMASDGSDSLENKSPNFYTDEELVVTAFFFAIGWGQETVILTRDEHVLDQFCKLKVLLVDSYYSMLLADAYSRDPLRFKSKPMPMDQEWAKDMFKGDHNVLVRRPSETLDELLPARYQAVPIHCWLVRERLTQVCFCAETEMARLLKTKGVTHGMNTDLLDGRNSHIWMGNGIGNLVGGWAAIAQDRVCSNGKFSFGLLDFHFALWNDDRFYAIRPVDPNLLILP